MSLSSSQLWRLSPLAGASAKNPLSPWASDIHSEQQAPTHSTGASLCSEFASCARSATLLHFMLSDGKARGRFFTTLEPQQAPRDRSSPVDSSAACSTAGAASASSCFQDSRAPAGSPKGSQPARGPASRASIASRPSNASDCCSISESERLDDDSAWLRRRSEESASASPEGAHAEPEAPERVEKILRVPSVSGSALAGFYAPIDPVIHSLLGGPPVAGRDKAIRLSTHGLDL